MELTIKDVKFKYSSRPVIENVSLDFASSEIVAVCGPNGVGKSTLLKCINRILTPEGNIFLDEQNIKKMKMVQIAKRIGYVPQDTSHVFSVTVFDMVLMGRRPHLGWGSSDTDEKKVIEILDMMGIQDIALRDFNELSGGQKQKVIISRALAQEPEIILMDEPTSNLDLKHQLEVMELIRYLSEKKKLLVIMAIHDLNLASRYADKIILMKNGMIHSAGNSLMILTPENILSVYGVIAAVRNEFGKPYVVPIAKKG